jgi:hypothetical protein
MSPSANADLAQATQAGALAAADAGLRYVSDADDGLRRIRNGNGFGYRNRDGSRVDDPATLARIQALAIPPAWTDVWICPSPRGHLQASGRDARGRKQYRYHPQWSEVRGNGKFDRVIAFGQALPKLRRRLRRDLKADGFPREKVLAIVVAVLAETLIRVGNPEYARSNRSFGLTTLRNRHVAFVCGGRARFRFRGRVGSSTTSCSTMHGSCGWCATASSCRGRRCSSTATMTATWCRWESGEVTTTCATPPATRSPQRISAHGAARSPRSSASRARRCGRRRRRRAKRTHIGRTAEHGGQGRGRRTGQYPRDLPQGLHPSGGVRRLARRRAAAPGPGTARRGQWEAAALGFLKRARRSGKRNGSVA